MFWKIPALKIEFFPKFTSQNLTGGSFWMIMEGVSHTKSGIFSKIALCTDHGLCELTLKFSAYKEG